MQQASEKRTILKVSLEQKSKDLVAEDAEVDSDAEDEIPHQLEIPDCMEQQCGIMFEEIELPYLKEKDRSRFKIWTPKVSF